jgi:hypothetical protein
MCELAFKVLLRSSRLMVGRVAKDRNPLNQSNVKELEANINKSDPTAQKRR